MMVAVNHHDWKVLRQLVRAKGKPVPGLKLRLDMSRRSKGGTFLAELVRVGLLVYAAKHDDPLVSTYRLTERGKAAAEYGEYETSWDEIKAMNASKGGK